MFFKISEREISKFGRNLLLVKFGSERVELYRIAFRGATKSYLPGKLSGIIWTEAAQAGSPKVVHTHISNGEFKIARQRRPRKRGLKSEYVLF